MDKIEVGNVVIIRSDIINWNEYQGWTVTDEMYRRRGQSFSVIDVRESDYYGEPITLCRLSGHELGGFWFTPDMIELVSSSLDLDDKINIFDFLNK